MDTRGETGARRAWWPGGLGGIWAVDGRHGTGPAQSSLLRLGVTITCKRFSYWSTHNLCTECVMNTVCVFLLCRLKINHEMEYFMCLFLVLLARE